MLRKRRHPAPAAAATFNAQPMAPSHLRSSDGAPPSHDRPSACCYDACCVEQRRLSTRHRILRFMASGVRSLAGTLSTLTRGYIAGVRVLAARIPGYDGRPGEGHGQRTRFAATHQCVQAMQATLPRSHTNVHACMHLTHARAPAHAQRHARSHTRTRALSVVPSHSLSFSRPCSHA